MRVGIVALDLEADKGLIIVAGERLCRRETIHVENDMEFICAEHRMESLADAIEGSDLICPTALRPQTAIAEPAKDRIISKDGGG